MDSISLERKVREAYLSIKMEECTARTRSCSCTSTPSTTARARMASRRPRSATSRRTRPALTLAEAATLVGIPQSPTYNNPIDNPDELPRPTQRGARPHAVERLHRPGRARRRARPSPSVRQPHRAHVRRHPRSTPTSPATCATCSPTPKGLTSIRKDEVFKGGLKVVTTLDVNTQEAAEVAAANKEPPKPTTTWKAIPSRCPWWPSIPTTGYVKALVGGRDYYTSQVNLATGLGGSGRQAGSSFKTFTAGGGARGGHLARHHDRLFHNGGVSGLEGVQHRAP